MTNVVNMSRGDIYDVYIGRPSKWGNPFTHLKEIAERDGLILVPTRLEAVRRYEAWLQTQPGLLADIRAELKDKRLGCWCVPKSCHGSILARLADEEGLL